MPSLRLEGREQCSQPVAKKRRVGSDGRPGRNIQAGVPPHPLAVKPLGNAWDAQTNIKSCCGSFVKLPEELLLLLLELFDAPDLVNLGATCKALYAFCRAEELWKLLFLQSPLPKFSWHGTWRSTYLRIPPGRTSFVSCANLYSDVLYRPFFCANTPLAVFASNIPSSNRISRFSNLTAEDFCLHWADKPFILTEPVKEWPVFRSWSISNLVSKHGKTCFRAEAVDWPLDTYVNYMQNNIDESPLYLFDQRFAEKMRLVVGSDGSLSDDDYWPPTCFAHDFFSLFGIHRPDHRWLILGPARSGSTFHKDPNGTSAWNAVIRGSKYWIMFPSSSSLPPPPGVFVSTDQSEVTSPLSIAEWLLSYHAEARRTEGCIEGVCVEGEVLHVPSGWYHLVLNLEETLAITQNFVPLAHLPRVLHFLRDKRDQVSGFDEEVTDPYGMFVGKLEESCPDALSEASKQLLGTEGKGFWYRVTSEIDATVASRFTFGFDADDIE